MNNGKTTHKVQPQLRKVIPSAIAYAVLKNVIQLPAEYRAMLDLDVSLKSTAGVLSSAINDGDNSLIIGTRSFHVNYLYNTTLFSIDSDPAHTIYSVLLRCNFASRFMELLVWTVDQSKFITGSYDHTRWLGVPQTVNQLSVTAYHKAFYEQYAANAAKRNG
jgi:hypothetical protein